LDWPCYQRRLVSAEAVFQRVFRQFSSAVNAQPSHYVRLVECHRLARNLKNHRDFFDVMSLRHQLQHFPLPVRQFAGRLHRPERPTRQFTEVAFLISGVI